MPAEKKPMPEGVSETEMADLRQRIEAYEEADRMRETGAFTGYARCPNRSCERFEGLAEIAMVVDVRETRAPDVPGLVLATAEYPRPLDDADIACPACGTPRALMRDKPPAYPQMAPR